MGWVWKLISHLMELEGRFYDCIVGDKAGKEGPNQEDFECHSDFIP